VRRHSASERVELRLDHAADGTTLTVQDHGVAPAAPNGDGYGLTGMRERAELLGGRLSAGPTSDGFRVQLWLPASGSLALRASAPSETSPQGEASP
jgi:signal transduction histidine kinase